MNKRVVLSGLLISLILPATVSAVEDLSSMFSEGKVSGNIREFSISRAITDTRSSKEDYTRRGNSIGGHLKFETADYKGLSFGTAFYTTNGFLLDDPKTDYTKVDPTLFGKDNENFSLLGEAYLQYKYKNTTFKGGRQKLNTPLAGADDVRMIPNFFEAYIVSNKDMKDTTVTLGHIISFSQGTFARAYDGGLLAITAGYSEVDTRDNVGKFVNMGTYAVGESTDGVTVGAVKYKGVEGLKIQVWDYYAYDIVNAIYADASYKSKVGIFTPFLAAQIISEQDVGKKYAGDLSGFYWGTKAGASVKNFTLSLAYSQTSKNSDGDDATTNAIISPWGGIPAYTQGMVTRHMFLAGTQAAKAALSYNFKSLGTDLKTVLYYANYAMDKNNGYTEDDARELGFDFIYKPQAIKNLQLRLRANYSKDFYVKDSSVNNTLNGSVGWDEYRFIMNYKF